MKNLIVLACLLLSVNVALGAQTKPQKKVGPKAQLGTSFKLDGSTLRGKYQTALGTNATVENDKYLDDLLGGRKSFQDRIQEDAKRN